MYTVSVLKKEDDIMNLRKRIGLLLLALLTLFTVAGCEKNKLDEKENVHIEKDVEGKSEKEEVSLLVYSGAGLKKPMTKIAKEFEEETGIKIEYVFAGSTQLLSQLELTGKGDVFIVGAINAYEAAQKKGLADEYKTVAYHNPIIGVPKGNPANIESLEDLGKDGIKVILGDEEANAIGKTSQKIIKKHGLEKINDNVVAKTATVNELIVHLAAKDADAAIITEDSAFGNKDIDTVAIPEADNIPQILPIGSLKMTEHEAEAREFVDFVSSEKGKKIFESFGFPPVK